MPVNLTAAALATAMRVGTTTEELTEVTRLLDVGTDAVERHLGPLCYDRADTSAVNEAAIRLAAYLYDMPNAGGATVIQTLFVIPVPAASCRRFWCIEEQQ